MKTKTKKLEWEYHNFRIIDKKQNLIAEVFDTSHRDLIASAPELLSACEQALKALLPHFDDDEDGSDEANASNALMKAVAKAKGK